MSTQSHDQQVQAFKDLISTLPLTNGLRLYNGSYIHEDELLRVFLSQQHFKAEPTDIILATYPMSGTTWLKANAFAILNRLPNNNLRDHALLKVHSQECLPYIEFHFTTDEQLPPINLTNPRAISTHMVYSLLPKSIHDAGSKIVYVLRDPKDTLVSLWHFVKKAMKGEDIAFAGLTLEKVADEFCMGMQRSLGCASVWQHQYEYLKASKEKPDRVLVLRYEDMLEKPEESVRVLAEFMGKGFTEEEVEGGVLGDIVKLCSFNFLKELEVNNGGVFSSEDIGLEKMAFFRKGKAGSWKEDLSQEIAERVDKITNEKLGEFNT